MTLQVGDSVSYNSTNVTVDWVGNDLVTVIDSDERRVTVPRSKIKRAKAQKEEETVMTTTKFAYMLYAHHADGACSEIDRTAEVSLEEGNWGSMMQFNAASDDEVQAIVLAWRQRMIKLGGWVGGEYGTLMVQQMPVDADPNSDDIDKIFPDEGWGTPIMSYGQIIGKC